jgi:hypothetical protein
VCLSNRITLHFHLEQKEGGVCLLTPLYQGRGKEKQRWGGDYRGNNCFVEENNMYGIHEPLQYMKSKKPKMVASNLCEGGGGDNTGSIKTEHPSLPFTE